MSPRLPHPISPAPRAILKRLAVLGALGTTLGIVAPVASASAAGRLVAPAKLAAFPFPGFVMGAFPWEGAGLSGQAISGSVVGPVIVTTAPSSFINSNTQVAGVGNATGVQVTVP
jgi:hypothetical protein